MSRSYSVAVMNITHLISRRSLPWRTVRFRATSKPDSNRSRKNRYCQSSETIHIDCVHPFLTFYQHPFWIRSQALRRYLISIFCISANDSREHRPNVMYPICSISNTTLLCFALQFFLGGRYSCTSTKPTPFSSSNPIRPPPMRLGRTCELRPTHDVYSQKIRSTFNKLIELFRGLV